MRDLLQCVAVCCSVLQCVAVNAVEDAVNAVEVLHCVAVNVVEDALCCRCVALCCSECSRG